MKNNFFKCLLLIPYLILANEQQTPYTLLNVTGFYIDPATGKVDDTAGFGAFDSIMELFNPNCPCNFDNGGGAFDDNSKFAKEKYNIENIVYDPFMRSEEHNKKILELIKNKKFDCTTSFSILNVIDLQSARIAHISLCYEALKDNGLAFFKVWCGNCSGIGEKFSGGYQSNQKANFYVDEIKKVFGNENVFLIDDRTIKAIKTLKDKRNN